MISCFDYISVIDEGCFVEVRCNSSARGFKKPLRFLDRVGGNVC
jgi:hypothetical protein